MPKIGEGITKMQCFREIGAPLLEGDPVSLDLPAPLWGAVIDALEADCQQSSVILENMGRSELELLCLTPKELKTVLAPFFAVSGLVDQLVRAGWVDSEKLKSIVVWYQKLIPLISTVKRLRDEGRWNYDLDPEFAPIMRA